MFVWCRSYHLLYRQRTVYLAQVSITCRLSSPHEHGAGYSGQGPALRVRRQGGCSVECVAVYRQLEFPSFRPSFAWFAETCQNSCPTRPTTMAIFGRASLLTYVLLLSLLSVHGAEAKDEECGELAGGATCPLNVCCSKWGFCGTTPVGS
jgi:hypothetical protein